MPEPPRTLGVVTLSAVARPRPTPYARGAAALTCGGLGTDPAPGL